MQRQKNDDDGYGNDKKSDEQVWKDRRTLALVVFLALLSTFCLVYIGQLIGTESSNIGEMGDWIAGSTSIVLQSIVIYYIYQTYHNQKKELQDQRSMLKTANDEARRKRFEDVFYDLLTRYEGVVSRLYLPESSKIVRRQVFVIEANYCEKYFRDERGAELMRRYMEERDWWLADWVRIIFLITKVIRESEWEEERDRVRYVDIFRGLLSSHESQVLVMYLTTRDKGKSETAEFMLKNDFFRYSQFRNLLHHEVIEQLLVRKHGYGVKSHADIE